MFQTLKFLVPVGGVTVVAGNQMLRKIAKSKYVHKFLIVVVIIYFCCCLDLFKWKRMERVDIVHLGFIDINNNNNNNN